MGDLVALRRDDHEGLGILALQALEQGRPYLAIVHLAQVYLDTAPDKERAEPLAKQLAAFNNVTGGSDGVA